MFGLFAAIAPAEPASNPDAARFAALVLLIAVLAVALGTGAILAVVLRRGRRLRTEAHRPHDQAHKPAPLGAWYQAGKRVQPEALDDTDTDDDQDQDQDPGEPNDDRR